MHIFQENRLNDCIVITKEERALKEVEEFVMYCEIKDKVKLTNTQGIKFREANGRHYKSVLTYLASQMLETLDFNERTKVKNMPEVSIKILYWDKKRFRHIVDMQGPQVN